MKGVGVAYLVVGRATAPVVAVGRVEVVSAEVAGADEVAGVKENREPAPAVAPVAPVAPVIAPAVLWLAAAEDPGAGPAVTPKEKEGAVLLWEEGRVAVAGVARRSASTSILTKCS